MSKYDEKADITFEQKTWKAARVTFSKKHDPKNFEPFLKDYTTPDVARKSVVQAQKEANSEYNGKLGGILEKVDMFMKVGDLAMKSAPESVGLAWTGVRMCLHAVQDDFATFALFSGVCTDILGILISCRVYGKLYANKDRPEDFVELHDKVLSYIGDTYTNIIEFSYQMWKYTRSNTGMRIVKGLLRSASGKFQPMIQGLRDNEGQMNKFATQASQQMSEYYQRQGLDNDVTMMKSFSEQREMLQEMQDTSNKQNQMLMDILKHQSELHKKDLNKTASDLAGETLEQQLKEFGSIVDNQETFHAKIEMRKKGTCRWILENEDFKAFAEAERGKVVWLVGNGGSGKSFLMSTVIEEMQKRAGGNEDCLVHYFFISKTSQATSHSEEILKDLLLQLYKNSNTSLDVLDKCNKAIKNYLRDQKGGSGSRGAKSTTATETFDFSLTYKTLAKAIGKKIFLVVDALDECVDLEAEGFVQSLRKLAEDEELQVNVHFSGRDEPSIAGPLQGCAQISVESNNIADIERHVQIEMDKLPGFTAVEREQARQEITRKAGSYFRYVELAIDFMRQPWRRPLSKHLESLPPGVNNLYAQRLEKTDPVYYDLLTTCLTWTILAGRELTVQELIDVYRGTYTSEETGDDVLEEDEGTDGRLYEEQIVKAGNEFLRVSPDRTVSTVHNTVRDFFLQSENSKSEVNGSPTELKIPECTCARCQSELKNTKKFQVVESDGHLQICITILQHLLSPSFQKKYIMPKRESEEDEETGDADSDAEKDLDVTDETEKVNGSKVEPNQHERDTNATIETNGVLDTSTSQDNGDAQLNGVTDQKQNRDTSDGDVLTNGSAASKLVDVSDSITESASNNEPGKDEDQNPDSETREDHPVPTAAVEDSEDGASNDGLSVADSDDKFDYDDDDMDFNYAEAWAEGFPRRYEVQYLIWHLSKLEKIYPIEERSGDQWDQLRSLLDRFFTHDSEAWLGWLRTLWAISEPLDRLATTYDDYNIIHPIHVAVAYGLTSIVQILLSRPNASELASMKLPWGPSPLWLTLWWQLIEEEQVTGILTALLDAGADPNEHLTVDEIPQQSPFGGLLLCKVTTVDQVSLFLKHGADVHALNAGGTSALHAFAKGYGGLEVGKALIEAGADINCRSKIGETPLHWLVRRQKLPLDILQYFIEIGAEIDAEDDASERPLLECSKLGHIEGMRVLLDHGADIEDPNDYNMTALFTAGSLGQSAAVEYLLERGADPFRASRIGSSVFNAACKNADEKTALILGKTFVERGRTDLLDYSYPNGKSTLMKAATKGYLEIIDLILENADKTIALNKTSKKGRQPLHFAAMKGRKAAVEKLLAYGADATSKDKKGLTPLQLCCSKIVGKPTKEVEDTALLLIEHGPEAAIADMELLHTLVIYNAVKIVDKFLQLGADPYTLDVHGWNALQLARQYERTEIIGLINASQPRERGIQPTRFVGKTSKTHAWSADGLELEKLVSEEMTLYSEEGGCTCRPSDQTFITDHPIPVSTERYYYEVTLDPMEKNDDEPLVAVGACQKPTRALKLWFPGWLKAGMSSWGFHSDDGLIHCFGDPPLKRDLGSAKKWGPGDTVGCGIDLKQHEIFWTLNGQRLMKAGWINVRGQIYPACIISSKGTIKINLGTDLVNKPFMWKPGNTLDFDSDIPPPQLTRWKTGDFRN